MRRPAWARGVVVAALLVGAAPACVTEEVHGRYALTGESSHRLTSRPVLAAHLGPDRRAVYVFEQTECIDAVTEEWELVETIDRSPGLAPMITGGALVLLFGAAASAGSSCGGHGCGGGGRSGLEIVVLAALPSPLIFVPILMAEDTVRRSPAPSRQRFGPPSVCDQAPRPGVEVRSGAEVLTTDATGGVLFGDPVDPRRLLLDGQYPARVYP